MKENFEDMTVEIKYTDGTLEDIPFDPFKKFAELLADKMMKEKEETELLKAV